MNENLSNALATLVRLVTGIILLAILGIAGLLAWSAWGPFHIPDTAWMGVTAAAGWVLYLAWQGNRKK